MLRETNFYGKRETLRKVARHRLTKAQKFVSGWHKVAFQLSTYCAGLPMMLGFRNIILRTQGRGRAMRAAFLVGCAALLLSACSSEPVQQATAAHVAPGLKAAMSNGGQAHCAMIGGSLSVARQLDGSMVGMCALPNGKRCTEQSLATGSCGSY